MIFVDFDDVLFNTRKFKRDYLKVFLRHNVSREIFEKTYYADFAKEKSSALRCYDPWRQIERIAKETDIDKEKLKKDLFNFLHSASDYIFPDVKNFLEKLSKKNLILVSYGIGKFQKEKIKNSGIVDYFQKIYVTKKMKGEVIKNYLQKTKTKNKTEKIYFLDDRAEQIENVKKIVPKVETIFICRLEGRFKNCSSECCDYAAKNLKEVEKIILNLKF